MTLTTDPRLKKQVDEHPYPLLFTTISGAHLYGFPSADSDFDLRGVHILPREQVLGLRPVRETIQREFMEDGLEIDLVTHDVKKFFLLLLKKNGYVMEQVLSPLVVHTTPEHEELCAIANRCLTKHHTHHYLGFSANEWDLFCKHDRPRVKPLLYIYRVLLTGIRLMQTGKVEANLNHLNEEERLPNLRDLIDQKVHGKEKCELRETDLDFHKREYQRLRDKLKMESERSSLPETPQARSELHDLLIRIRMDDRFMK